MLVLQVFITSTVHLFQIKRTIEPKILVVQAYKFYCTSFFNLTCHTAQTASLASRVADLNQPDLNH